MHLPYSIRRHATPNIILAVALCFLSLGRNANAQVFDLGPSDPDLFWRVYDLPEDFSQFPYQHWFRGYERDEVQLNIGEGVTLWPFGREFTAYSHIEVNFDGGELGLGSRIYDHAELNVSSGVIGDRFRMTAFSVLNVTGGQFGDIVFVGPSTVANISGGIIGDQLEAGRDDFSPDGSESIINISGGTIGDRVYADLGSQINISGGTIGDRMFAYIRSTINISGGTIGNRFEAESAEINISDGTIGNDFTVDYSEVNISGGTIGDGFSARRSSEVHITGGTFGSGFRAISGRMNLYGSAFSLDGVPIEGLSSDQPVQITQKGVQLTGVFSDGSPFSFDLNEESVEGEDWFRISPYLHYVPVLGDFNGDGAMTNGDIAPSVQALTDRPGYDATFPELDADQLGDFTGDGALTNGDIAGFVAALTGGGNAALPEPGSLGLIALSGSFVLLRRRRSQR